MDIVGPKKHKPTSLQAIADKAKAVRKHRFQNLYGCLNEEYLYRSWRKLNRRACPGVDGVDWREYGRDLKSNLVELVESLKAKRYKAKLVKRCYIPKAKGKRRPLGVPVVADKVLQCACSDLLTAIYEADFLPVSFGYRPGRGARDAVDSLTATLQFGRYGYVVEADIKGFFDNLDHDWLLRMLEQRIDDRPFLSLIRKWLKAGILDTDGKVINPVTGTPQGGVISPVLANVYLHYALDLWFMRVFKRRCRGEAMMCRYADDFVCAFQYKEDAEAFYRELPKRLSKFSLEVAAEKTAIHRFSRFHPGRKRRFSFLGFEFYWGSDKKGISRVKRRTAPDRLCMALNNFTLWIKANRHVPIDDLMGRLSAKLRGYYNYYGVKDNMAQLWKYFFHIQGILFKWLNRRSQRCSYTWKGFKELLLWFKIPRPCASEVQTRRVFLDRPC